MKIEATEEDGTIITTDYYRKGNLQVVFLERDVKGEISKVSMYNNGERTDTFTETKDSKVAHLNSGMIIAVNIYNQLETDNKWQTLLGSMLAKVKSVTYNEKECYIVEGFLSSMTLNFEGEKVYIEKDTGLLVKNIGSFINTERQYKFGSIEDEIFIEPNIGQYTLYEEL